MRYPGGKNGAGVYQRIINLQPPHDVYVEPFLGGAAIMRLKRPARRNIGLDLDRAVLETASSILTVRARPEPPDPALVDPESERCRREIAARESMLRNAEFPEEMEGLLQGLQDWSAELRILDSASPYRAINPGPSPLAGTVDGSSFEFHHEDGIEFLATYPFRGTELVYCDPPYLTETRRGGRLYRHEMSDAQHARLLEVIRALPCRVMISGYWSELYGRALGGWQFSSFRAMTRRGLATECIWWNFPAPVELHDYQHLGANFRERERIKRKKNRWTARLAKMPLLERQALLGAISESSPINSFQR